MSRPLDLHNGRRTEKARPARALTGLYVLVVDDDLRTREVLHLLLAYHGAAVVLASTARAGLAALQRHAADVVIADVVLGDAEDGMWLVRQAQSRWPWVPFLLMSGEDVNADVLTTSYVAYLRKPVPSELLVDAVLAAVAHPTT